MTARAGRKRRVPQPKMSARERLLAATDPEQVVREFNRGAPFAKLRKRIGFRIRMHERELAERAVAEARRRAALRPFGGDFCEVDAADIRASILGQPKARGRVRGGAR